MRASVESRSAVGMLTLSRTSSGPEPMMQTHLVPPNSTPASRGLGREGLSFTAVSRCSALLGAFAAVPLQITACAGQEG